MNKLQLKYNALHILYWMATCAIYGYVAVFLQYKGMTNTEIGFVTGGGCVCTIFLSPYISSLVSKVKSLSINKIMYILFSILSILFLVISIFDLPNIVIMGAYVLLLSLIVSTVPFLSMIAMNYIKTGEQLNFGLSRGLGSVSYAVSAVLLGQFIEFFNPTVLSYIFVISAVLLLLLLRTFPKVESNLDIKEGSSSVVTIVKKYKVFFFILIGFGCMFAASTAISTYLINIVKNLNGSTSTYGIAIFFMAASEMPVMALTPRLMKKYDSMTLIKVAAVFYIIRNFTICLAFNLPILFGGMMMQSMSYGLLTAVITYYVNSHLEEQDQMMGQTMIAIMTSGIGSMIGNVLGGVLQDTFGINAMFVFVCSVTVIGVAVIFFTSIYAKKRATELEVEIAK